MSLVDRVREILPPKHRELAKFVVVGGASWLVDVGVFYLLLHTVLEDKPLTSKAFSVLVSTVFSYILNREWSFNHRGGRERHHEAALFFVANALALGVNLIPLALSRYVLQFRQPEHAHAFVVLTDFISANVLGTLVAMAFRYWAYRRFVFPDELHPHGEDDYPDAEEIDLYSGPHH